jgi:hypothetical protein
MLLVKIRVKKYSTIKNINSELLPQMYITSILFFNLVKAEDYSMVIGYEDGESLFMVEIAS